MDKINSAIRCVNCLNILSNPIILPCSHSICKSHISTNGDVKCQKCGQQHSTYFESEALSAVTQIGTLEFGKGHKEAMHSCEQLSVLINQVDLLLKDPESYIYDTFSEMKRRADLRHEEIKIKLDQEWLLIVEEINKLGADSKEKLNSKVNLLLFRELMNAKDTAQKELDQHFSDLNELKIDEAKWKLIKEQSHSKYESLQEKKNEFKKAIFERTFESEAFNKEFFKKIDIDPFCDFSEVKIESTILTNQKITNAFVKLCEFASNAKLDLLYRGSRDGFGFKDFHSKCDYKPKTVTIVKTTKNFVFGGYTEAVWNCNLKSYCRDSNAFLFSLLNHKTEPIKIKITSGEHYAIFNGNNGPSFGCDYGFAMCNNCNENNGSLAILGGEYKHPKYENNSVEANNFLASSKYFQVAEIEVFQLV